MSKFIHDPDCIVAEVTDLDRVARLRINKVCVCPTKSEGQVVSETSVPDTAPEAVLLDEETEMYVPCFQNKATGMCLDGSSSCPGIIYHCQTHSLHCVLTDDYCRSRVRDVDELGQPDHVERCCTCGKMIERFYE